MKRATHWTMILLPALASGIALAGSTKHSAVKSHAYVGVAIARRSALRSVPGHVLSTKLENEDGKMQYAVMIKDKKSMHEVMVDAHTGKVVSQEKVTAAEEAREAAAEARAAYSKHLAPKHK